METEEQRKIIEEVSERIVQLADDYVKMEAADCDDNTKALVLKAFVRGFTLGTLTDA